MAADQRTLAAAERQQQLEHEAAEAAQQMVGLLRSAISICDTAAATAAGGAENAGAAATTAQMAVHAQQQRLEAAQADLLAAQREAQQGSGGGASGVLQQGVAAAEEEVRLLMEQQKQRRELEAQLAAAQTAASQAATAHAAATAELEAARQAQRQAAANADAAESAASAPALRSSLGSEEQRLMAAVAGCEQAVVAASAAVEEGSGRLEVLQAEAARLKAAAAAAASGGGSINAAALASLNAQVQQQRAQLEALQAAEQEAAAEVGTLSTRLARAAGGGGAGSESKDSAAWRPLHRCFTLRQPEDCKPWAQALQVLTGGQLGVVVADTLAAASQLLSSGSGGAGVRIWPLDTLAAADRTEEQRRVARRFPAGEAGKGLAACLLWRTAAFAAGARCQCLSPLLRLSTLRMQPFLLPARPAGKVVLPLDLLAFEERHRPAMLRAFGSHVIAAADAVAEELSTRWGVASVTVDGRITSRGTLQVGLGLATAAARMLCIHVCKLQQPPCTQAAMLMHCPSPNPNCRAVGGAAAAVATAPWSSRWLWMPPSSSWQQCARKRQQCRQRCMTPASACSKPQSSMRPPRLRQARRQLPSAAPRSASCSWLGSALCSPIPRRHWSDSEPTWPACASC